MDGAMVLEDDVVEAVLTCEGDFHDPELLDRIERFRHRLKDLLLTGWSSPLLTFCPPTCHFQRVRMLSLPRPYGGIENGI